MTFPRRFEPAAPEPREREEFICAAMEKKCESDSMVGFGEVRRKLSASKKALAREYGVKELGIFGSYARGEQKKGSDVDILVEFSKVPDLRFISLEIALEKLLGAKVDLVRKKTLRPELRDYILKEVVYV